MRDKGIVRMLEAIIACIIILTVMSFFFTSKFKPQIEDNLIYVQAYDALGVLNADQSLKNYVKNNDAQGLTESFSSMFPSTLGFSIQVKGTVNPEIYVAGNCTGIEINGMRNSLQPLVFEYKKRRIEIFLSNSSIDPIKEGSNVLLFCRYTKLSDYSHEIEEFLSSGGTVFLLADLAQNEVEDGFLNTTFNLSWSSTTAAQPGYFVTTNDPKNTSTKIFRYYDNITVESFDDVNRLEFSEFHNTNIASGSGTVVTDSTGTKSFVKVVYNLGSTGKGRFVWFNGYDTSNPDANSTIIMNNLLKSSLMWASGESFSMDYPVEKQAPENRVQMHYFIAGSGNYDPFEIVLTVWRIFF